MNDKAISIMSSKLAAVSGWGTGLAILFVPFVDGVDLVPEALNLLDTLFALCAVVFTAIVFSAASAGIATFDESSAQMDFHVPFAKRILGGLICMAFLLGGWLLLEAAPDIQGAVRSATALGASMATLGAVVLYMGAANFIKEKRNKRA